jgi:hypothetical protein
MKKPASPPAFFEPIQAFLDHSRGQITIGEIPPIRSAALAAEAKKVRVALVRRDGETVADLLCASRLPWTKRAPTIRSSTRCFRRSSGGDLYSSTK